MAAHRRLDRRRTYRLVEVQDRDVPALIAEFEAIGNDVERFNAFVEAAAV
jgi:hypothetical protein